VDVTTRCHLIRDAFLNTIDAFALQQFYHAPGVKIGNLLQLADIIRIVYKISPLG